MAGAANGTAQSAASAAVAHRGADARIQPPAGEGALRLRAGRVADLPALLALEAGFPGDRLAPRQLRRHLASPTACLRVLVERTAAGPQVRGYVLLFWHARRSAARLYSLVVDPACRGRGFGARLLADAERQARRRGCPALRLEVRSDNVAARALYQRAGYREIARRPGYYEDGGEARCLQRTLSP